MIVWGNLICFLVCAPALASLPPLAEVVRPLAVVAGMGVFQLGLGYLCLSRGLRHVPAVEASLLGQLEPALNPVWAFLAVGERPGPWALAGGAIVIAAVVFLALSRSRQAPAAAAAQAS